MSNKGENLDKVLMGILEEEGGLLETVEEIIEAHGEISEPDLIKAIREKAITIGINKCADFGLIKIRMDNNGQAMMSTNRITNHKIKQFESELSLLENGGFPIPYKDFGNIPELSPKSKLILMRFAKFLSEKRIKLELCSQWEYGFLFSVFKHIENGFKLTKKQHQKLQDIINRCQERGF